MTSRPDESEAAAGLRGATWMASAFAAGFAVDLLAALVVAGSAQAGEPASRLVWIGGGASAVAIALRLLLFVVALRMSARAGRAVPWLVVVIAAILAFASYPASVAVYIGVTMTLAQRSPQELADWSMGSAYVHSASGLANMLLVIGVLIAAALLWARRAGDASA